MGFVSEQWREMYKKNHDVTGSDSTKCIQVPFCDSGTMCANRTTLQALWGEMTLLVALMSVDCQKPELYPCLNV